MTVSLTSLWKPCAAALLPLVTACATGPAPLTAEQQVQIETARATQAQTAYISKSQERLSIKLYGLYDILDKQNGTLPPKEIQTLSAEIFKTIQEANAEEREMVNTYLDNQIKNAVAQGQEGRAKQIAVSRVFSTYGQKIDSKEKKNSPFLECVLGHPGQLSLKIKYPLSEINLDHIQLGSITYAGLCNVKRGITLDSQEYQKEAPILAKHGFDLKTAPLQPAIISLGAAPAP